MLTLLLAAALTAATPTPPTPAPAPVQSSVEEIAKALPLVCEAHFIEETKIKVSGLTGHKALVIDLFAEKENLTPDMKAQVEGVCAFFDLGASFIIDQLNQQQKDAHHSSLRKPFDDVVSFPR